MTRFTLNYCFYIIKEFIDMKKEIKIVAISDTHGSIDRMQKIIEDKVEGDIFIHAGDFTRYGKQQYFLSFFKCLQAIKFKYKIVIAGNHEISLDNSMKPERKETILKKYPCQLTRDDIVREIGKRAIYLEHDLVEVEGLRIFGSPYTKKYSRGAFQYNKFDDALVWNSLPENIDILITHEPPFGILDQSRQQQHAGSKALLEEVKRIKPKLHIFGHIHQSHGKEIRYGVKFMNVSKAYEIVHIQ